MQRWKFTSYENGEQITRTGLSKLDAVRAIEDAMEGRMPESDEERREPGTAEHRIAA